MENEKIIHRIFKYLKYKGIPHTRFEKMVGLSNGYLKVQLKRGADIGESVLRKIIDNSIDINPEWLLTGRGEMLRDAPPAGGHLEQVAGKMELLEQERELLREQVRFLREKLTWAEKQMQELKQSVMEKEKHIRQCRELTKKPGDAVGNKPEKLK